MAGTLPSAALLTLARNTVDAYRPVLEARYAVESKSHMVDHRFAELRGEVGLSLENVLMVATYMGESAFYEQAKTLFLAALKEGADINGIAKGSYIAPIQLAAKLGRIEMMRLAKDSGAAYLTKDLPSQDPSLAAIATSQGRAAVLEFLAGECGIDLDRERNWQNRPLSLITLCDNPPNAMDVLKALEKHRFDFLQTDKNGFPLLQVLSNDYDAKKEPLLAFVLEHHPELAAQTNQNGAPAWELAARNWSAKRDPGSFMRTLLRHCAPEHIDTARLAAIAMESGNSELESMLRNHLHERMAAALLHRTATAKSGEDLARAIS